MNYWVDIKNVDVIFVMGGNVVEVYLCGFKWVMEVKVYCKVWLIVVDLCFMCMVLVVDYYVLICIGIDIVFLGGVINYLLMNDKIQYEYVKNYMDFLFIVCEDFVFNDGIYFGYDVQKYVYLDKLSWDYECGDDGFVKVDLMLQYLCCVYNLLKQYYVCYMVDMVQQVCGMLKDKFLKVCEMFVSMVVFGCVGMVLYVFGWIYYLIGVQIICIGVMVQLLFGNIGIVGGGMNVLCGYLNIQGLIDFGLMLNLLLGYMMLLMQVEQDFDVYIKKCVQQLLWLNQLSYWKNYKVFYVSFMKLWWGDVVIVENNWVYDYLLKLDKQYDLLQVIELMNVGKMNGYICQGFNLFVVVLLKVKMVVGFVKLKWFVIMDLFVIEMFEFWKFYGDYNDVDLLKIQIEVFCLLIICFVEENGLFVSLSCVLQWYWKGVELLGEVRSDFEIMLGLFLCMCKLYQKDGGKYLDLIVNLIWLYVNLESLMFEELVMEFNGKVFVDLFDLKDLVKMFVKKGEQFVVFV